jgi:hypothetical protein
MRGAISPLPYAFISWCLVKHRDNFNILQKDHLRNIDVTVTEMLTVVTVIKGH